MNGIIGTAIVLAIVVGIVALVIRSMIKSKKLASLCSAVVTAPNAKDATNIPY